MNLGFVNDTAFDGIKFWHLILAGGVGVALLYYLRKKGPAAPTGQIVLQPAASSTGTPMSTDIGGGGIPAPIPNPPPVGGGGGGNGSPGGHKFDLATMKAAAAANQPIPGATVPCPGTPYFVGNASGCPDLIAAIQKLGYSSLPVPTPVNTQGPVIGVA